MGCVSIKVAVTAVDVSVPTVINREVNINNSLSVYIALNSIVK